MRNALVALWIASALMFAGGANAATFTVTKTTDTNDGTCDADCSLREAVVAANAAAGADAVVVPAGTFLLTIADTNEDLSANGDIDINDELTITGTGAGATIIDGNNATRVFHVLTSATVTISDVTIRNGNVSGFGGGVLYEGGGALRLVNAVIANNRATGFGGGINNNAGGQIVVLDSTVSNNTAGGFGGGINNNVGGSINVQSSIVSGNSASGFGGGINNNLNGTVTVTLGTISLNTGTNGGGINNNNVGSLIVDSSTIAQNTATGSIGGGGILNNNNGLATIDASTISGNTTAGFGGGGIDNNFGGTVNVVNSTVSGNTATGSIGGGGIYNNNAGGTVSLRHVTVTGNGSTNGGRSLHNNGVGGPGQFVLRSTIVANPASGANCVGTFASTGTNLASDASCGLTGTGDLPGTNPLLGPLANNGGPTQTHGLLAASPAVDVATSGPETDQRGVSRPVGVRFDIGAFEGTLAGGLPTLSINNVSAIEGNSGTTTFAFTATLSAASASTVTVGFATADGTATAGSDYIATNGTVTFPPGTTTQAVSVSVIGDTVIEGNETFLVNLSNPVNATLATAQGTGTIANDDSAAPPLQPPSDIPTLSEWMLLLLATLLGIAAMASLRGNAKR